jgi:outer membrane murein-binding lipoprotein Lpp
MGRLSEYDEYDEAERAVIASETLESGGMRSSTEEVGARMADEGSALSSAPQAPAPESKVKWQWVHRCRDTEFVERSQAEAEIARLEVQVGRLQVEVSTTRGQRDAAETEARRLRDLWECSPERGELEARVAELEAELAALRPVRRAAQMISDKGPRSAYDGRFKTDIAWFDRMLDELAVELDALPADARERLLREEG